VLVGEVSDTGGYEGPRDFDCDTRTMKTITITPIRRSQNPNDTEELAAGFGKWDF
jgi:hypothetical protein